MFVTKQFVLPAAPALTSAVALTPAPTAVPPAPAVSKSKLTNAASAAVAKAAATRVKKLRGLGCACQRARLRQAKTVAGLGRLGFNWGQLFESAGAGAGIDALTQAFVGGGSAKPTSSPTSSYPQLTPQNYNGGQVPGLTPAVNLIGPPPAQATPPPGYQYNAGGQLIPASSQPPAITAPSWFSQQTLISGVSNGTIVAVGGIGGALLVMMMSGRRSRS